MKTHWLQTSPILFILMMVTMFALPGRSFAQGQPQADSLSYSFRIILVKNALEKDEALVNFQHNFTKDFVDSTGDALKYFNPGINIWWRSADNYNLVINQYPIPETIDTLLLGVSASQAGIYSLEFSSGELPPYVSVLLFDSYQNILVDVRKTSSRSIVLNNDPASRTPGRLKLILIPAQAVPVQLQAKDSSGLVKINWTSEIEVNTLSYVVEHSTDGNNFFRIDSIATPDTLSFSQASYSVFHSNPAEGINYYRIQRVLSTGFVANYQEVQVTLPYASGMASLMNDEISLYPVPAASEVYVQVSGQMQKAKATINLYNTNGIRCYTNTSTGNAQINIPLNGLSAGVYWAHIFAEGKIYCKKLIKN